MANMQPTSTLANTNKSFFQSPQDTLQQQNTTKMPHIHYIFITPIIRLPYPLKTSNLFTSNPALPLLTPPITLSADTDFPRCNSINGNRWRPNYNHYSSTCFAGSLRCTPPTPSTLLCPAGPTSPRPTTPLTNLPTSRWRPAAARRNLSSASASWRTGTVPTRSAANSRTVCRSCEGTTS